MFQESLLLHRRDKPFEIALSGQSARDHYLIIYFVSLT